MGDTRRHRILSLDGGGTWAIVQVEALIQLYSPQTRGHDVLRDFSHAVANSGGSIVLAGLLLNARLEEIRNNFCDPAVRLATFSPIGAWQGGPLFKLFRCITGGPKYSTAKKRAGLVALFDGYARANSIGSQALADLAASVGPGFQFTIIGYDYRRDRAKYFRSQVQSRAASRDGSPQTPQLVDAVNASSSAPVQYFDRPADGGSLQGELFWDGAVTGQNNPLVSGVIEVLANGAQREDIAVLSIGTGGNAIPPDLAVNPPWQITSHVQRATADLQKAGRAIIGDPPDHASFVAHMMLTSRLPGGDIRRDDSPIVRMSPMIGPRPKIGNAPWEWPEGLATPEQRKITGLDMDAISADDFGRVHQLAQDWIAGRVRNHPIRMGTDLACDLGDETFGAALDRWKRIR